MPEQHRQASSPVLSFPSSAVRRKAPEDACTRTDPAPVIAFSNENSAPKKAYKGDFRIGSLSGEQFDTELGQQYLRARYYDQGTGSLNRVDPWRGVHEDPQSLHRYIYVCGDPVTKVDYSGNVGEEFTANIEIMWTGAGIVTTEEMKQKTYERLAREDLKIDSVRQIFVKALLLSNFVEPGATYDVVPNRHKSDTRRVSGQDEDRPREVGGYVTIDNTLYGEKYERSLWGSLTVYMTHSPGNEWFQFHVHPVATHLRPGQGMLRNQDSPSGTDRNRVKEKGIPHFVITPEQIFFTVKHTKGEAPVFKRLGDTSVLLGLPRQRELWWDTLGVAYKEAADTDFFPWTVGTP